eukprot:COSAG02_NODE_53456_length_301_cov_1.925743_1_plen_24_part_10
MIWQFLLQYEIGWYHAARATQRGL